MMKKHRLFSPLVLAVLAVAVGAGVFAAYSRLSATPADLPPAAAYDASEPFRSISPPEARKLMESRPDLVLLDVRTPEELQREGGIEGAVLVPFWAVMQNKLTVPREKPVMLVCAVGGRSYAAGQMLVRYGYREVYNLSGGFDAWKKSGLPVVR